MLTIDGSMGEGGGQILRSSLALSLCLGKAFRIIRIRARLLRRIGERDLHLPAEALELREVTDSQGPGNAVTLSIHAEHVTEVFTAFGQRGEAAAAQLVREAQRYLAADVPVGEHLADQLLLPLALAGGGAYVTLAPTQHTLTNMEVVRRFLDVGIRVERVREGGRRIEVGGG